MDFIPSFDRPSQSRLKYSSICSHIIDIDRKRSPLLEAMRIASDVLANRYIKREVGVGAMQVKESSSLRASLERTKIFPPMMMHMIVAGGKIWRATRYACPRRNNQDREFESLVNISLKVFEPFLIVFMATIVLFIVLAILQPILALNSMVNL